MNLELRTSTLLLALAKGGSLALTLGVSVLLARTLGPDAYGTYVFVTATLMLAAIPAFCGWPNLVVRHTARYQVEERWALIAGLLRTATLWVLGVGGLITLGFLWLPGVPADDPALGRLLRLGVALVILVGLVKVTSAGLRGLHQPLRAQLPEMLVQPLAQVLLLLALTAASALTASTAVVSLVASFALAAAVTRVSWWRSEVRRAGGEHATDTRNWFREWPLFAAVSFTSLVSAQVAIVVLGWLADPAAVALLRVGERAAQLVAVPLLVVNLVLAPVIARAHRLGDRAALQATSDSAIRWSLLAALPLALLLLLFGEPVLGWLFGADYAAAAVPMGILVVAQVVNVLMGSVAMLLNMSGNQRHTLLGFLVGLAVNLGGCFLLIPRLGMTGAALAVAAATITWNLMLAVKVRRLLDLDVGPWRALARGTGGGSR